ncbi:DUF3263 domain-containing protein [Cellulomonas sp. RIT-PI-Y]|uniref:DUF3263 domain-containing protein n=1 Tax=Cellulomonas sp. RIT-PI-Y TaxID=3035297 RepID=UPI0021DAE1DB|nr:DUF3263 domain-containing protein [Cellulomonas sp. RIT-PI-Y]
MSLTDADRDALDLEARSWRYAACKEAAIRDELGCPPIRHYQRVARLLDEPAAVAYAPVVVNRLRRARSRWGRRGEC